MRHGDLRWQGGFEEAQTGNSCNYKVSATIQRKRKVTVELQQQKEHEKLHLGNVSQLSAMELVCGHERVRRPRWASMLSAEQEKEKSKVCQHVGTGIREREISNVSLSERNSSFFIDSILLKQCLRHFRKYYIKSCIEITQLC